MHVGGALHVLKKTMNAVRGRLRKSVHGSAAGLFRSSNDRTKIVKIGNVSRGSQKIEMFFDQLSAARLKLFERPRIVESSRLVHQNHGLGLNLQAMMFRENIELMD